MRADRGLFDVLPSTEATSLGKLARRWSLTDREPDQADPPTCNLGTGLRRKSAGQAAVSGGYSSAYHHSSHMHLVSRFADVPTASSTASVDAIVVPINGHVIRLQHALNLAVYLQCTLVALCDKWASPKAALQLASDAKTEVIVVSTDTTPAELLPAFHTSSVLSGTRYELRTGVNRKRNIALLLARALGWRRVVFLDETCMIPERDDLKGAAALLDSYDAVGLLGEGFPDNSVLCHAFREVGGQQDTFVAGGALVVAPGRTDSFFPDIYDADWFYLLNENGLRPTAARGTVLRPPPHDPFREHEARMQEFGDCIAEGIYSIIDNELSLSEASMGFWRHYLKERNLFINEVIDMAHAMYDVGWTKHRIISALKAARGRNLTIPSELYVDYLAAWKQDRIRWREHLGDVPSARTAREAVDNLGMQDSARVVGHTERALGPTWW